MSTAQAQSVVASGLDTALPGAIATQRAIMMALFPVFGTAVFPNVAPDQMAAPYAVYSVISNVPNQTLASGAPLDACRYQIDVYATNYAQVQELAQAARFALLAIPYPISVTLALQIDQYESDVKLHRILQDFSIWTPRSVL